MAPSLPLSRPLVSPWLRLCYCPDCWWLTPSLLLSRLATLWLCFFCGFSTSNICPCHHCYLSAISSACSTIDRQEKTTGEEAFHWSCRGNMESENWLLTDPDEWCLCQLHSTSHANEGWLWAKCDILPLWSSGNCPSAGPQGMCFPLSLGVNGCSRSTPSHLKQLWPWLFL